MMATNATKVTVLNKGTILKHIDAKVNISGLYHTVPPVFSKNKNKINLSNFVSTNQIDKLMEKKIMQKLILNKYGEEIIHKVLNGTRSSFLEQWLEMKL